jgi:hypothetical protein
MKHLKIAGLCLTAMFAMSMIAAEIASAEPPAKPAPAQCVRVHENGTGNFEDSKCKKEKAKSEFIRTRTGGIFIENGVWCQRVWEAGTGTHNEASCEKKGGTKNYILVKHTNGFKSTSKSGTLRAANGTEIKCTSSTVEEGKFGAFKGEGEKEEEEAAKEVRIGKIKYNGCKSGGEECKTEGAAAEEITTRELTGRFGYVKKEAKTEVGLELRPSSGTLFSEFACTILKLKAKAKVTGCIIGRFEKINEMLTENKLIFTESAAKESIQVPLKFEGGAACELTEEDSIVKKAEKSAITTEYTLTVGEEEELEINA